MERIQLTILDTESEHTGWRKPNKERQETLKNIFLGGQYGLSVSNGVQILEKESGLGQKIIDDGVSTVAALKACAAEYADNSSLTREGNLWPESLVAMASLCVLLLTQMTMISNHAKLGTPPSTMKKTTPSVGARCTIS